MNKMIPGLVLAVTLTTPALGRSEPAAVVWAADTVDGVLTLPEPQRVTGVSYGAMPDDQQRPVEAFSSSAAGLLIRLPEGADAGYFRVTFEDGSEQVIGQRRLAFDNIENLRDLGGYRTEDGRQVRWGKLFRANELAGASTSDRQRLAALRIATICDLRTGMERDRRPTPDIAGARSDAGCHGPDVFDSDTLQQLAGEDGSVDAIEWEVVFTDFFRQLPTRYASQFGTLFRDVLATGDDQAVLFHCTAGKDRTGVASALLLLALGVPEQTVLVDFQLSERYFTGKTLQESLDGRFGGEVPRALIAASPSYLQAALDGIRADHGSVDNYLTSVLGLSAEEIARLRRQLLEPAADA